MGMQEKRIIANIQDNEIPFHQRNFAEVTKGGELAFDIDWDEWSKDYDGVLNLNGYVLQQFTDAISRIGVDAIGQEALREQIRTVKVIREEGEPSIALADGVVTLKVFPAKGYDGVLANSQIQEYLTENL